MTEAPRMNSEIQNDSAFIREVLNLTGTTKEEALKRCRHNLNRSLGVTYPVEVVNSITVVPPEGANSRQVGGSHYVADIQHWDIVEDYGVGYLEGCATKYVTRARKKNGLQDTEKAVHYIEKLIEKYKLGMGRKPRGNVPIEQCLQFIRGNALTDLEGAICIMLFTWKDGKDLNKTLTLTHQLVQQVRNSAPPGAGLAKPTGT